ncbi:hypothetical protein [Methanocaldococcus sp.]
MKNKIIFLILVLGILTQSYAYLTVKFNITNKDTGVSKTFSYYVDLNNLNNPKTYENDYSTIKLWLENYTNSGNIYYKLWWNITAKVNLTYTAELFNSTGEHPSLSGNNPYGHKDLNAGECDVEYWMPIKSEEVGPEYNPPKAKAPIPLGVVILTLIATPILTLRMVRK